MMVVVAIIGILIIVAYPMIKSRPKAIDVARRRCRPKILGGGGAKAVAGGAVRANVAQKHRPHRPHPA